MSDVTGNVITVSCWEAVVIAWLKSLMPVSIIGFKGVVESNCIRQVSKEGTKPANYPNPERESLIDPIFGVIILFLSWLVLL